MFKEEFSQPEKEYPQNPATPPPLPELLLEALSEGEGDFSPPEENEEDAADESPHRGPGVYPERSRGAPKGNQNARKHGFYSRKVSRREQAALEDASQVCGIAQEIALLRARIKTIQRTCPDDHDLMLRAMAALTRMVRLRGGM